MKNNNNLTAFISSFATSYLISYGITRLCQMSKEAQQATKQTPSVKNENYRYTPRKR